MKRILIVHLLAFASIVAFAQSWTAPQLTYTSEVKTYETVYLYNISQKQFLTKGGTWGTHASLGDADVAFPYTIYENGTYYALYSSSAAHTGYLFRASELSVYTDYNYNTGGIMYWQLTQTSKGTLRISTPEEYASENGYTADLVLGWNPDAEDVTNNGILMGTNVMTYMLDPDDASYAVDWALVTEENFQVFQARQVLYNLLLEAKDLGVSTTSASAVYNNAASTLSQLQSASTALQEAINKAGLIGASATNPKDATGYIVNPRFDNYANGWTLNVPGGQNVMYQSSSYYNGDSWVSQFIEAWILKGSYLGAGELSQTVYGLPEGKYVLEADVIATDQNGTYSPVSGVYLFADSDMPNSVSVSTGDEQPEHFSLTLYNTGSQLTIGLRTLADCTANWIGLDNVTLTYYGELSCLTKGISLSPTSLTLTMGEKASLTANINTNDEVFNRALWTSSNESVCTVSDEGTVTAIGSGTAVVTATAVNTSYKTTATITVQKNRPTGLIINEIQVANNDQFVDPSFNYGGWVEFYNPTATPVSLVGLHVSESADNLKEFQLPDGIGEVPAYGHRVVWFDHNASEGNYGPEAYKQVPFKLDYEGGTLYVSDSEGEIITSVTYPQATPRCSYARLTDGGGTWGTTSTPTPEESNDGSSFATERLAAPVVSTDGRVFTNSFTFRVTIPSGTTLRYTTDGSTPTLTNGATSANGRFSVSSTTIYRFALFQDGYLPSPVVTRSFIYQNHDYYLPVLSVVTAPDNLYDSTIGVYTRGSNGIAGNGQSSACNWNMDWERPVNMEFMVPEQNDEGETSFITYLNQETDFEIAGGWTRAYGAGWTDSRYWEMKSSFRLKTDKRYEGVNSIDYPAFPEKPYNKYKVWQVRNGGNDTYARIIDPALQKIVMKSGFYIDCQDARPAHVFLNGELLGMFNIRESNNRHYGYSNYGIDTDDMDQFDLSGAKYNQKVGDDVAWKELVALGQQLAGDQSADTFAKICERMDMDEYINYMALECFLGSSDWLMNTNNVKGFRSKSDGGKFHFVLFDLDAAFAYNNMLSRIMYDGSGQGKEVSDFFRSLMQYPPFQRRFVDAFCLVNGSVFEPNRCSEIVYDFYNQINTALGFEGNSSNTNVVSRINSYHNGSVLTNMKNYFGLGTGYRLNLSTNTTGARLTVNGQEVPTSKFDGYLYNFGGEGIRLTAKAPAGYVFKGWKQEETIQAENTTTLVNEAENWDYYDQGSLDGDDWTSPSYNALSNGWQTGQAPFGYANSGRFMLTNANTVLDYGGDSSNKRPTYYFRKTFHLDTLPTEAMTFRLNYQVDDGFRFYVNGQDINGWRCNAGCTYNYVTGDWAGNEPDTGTFTIEPAYLQLGDNVLAVEVHNNSLTSSDIYWDCNLTVSETSSSVDYLSTGETFCLTDLEGEGTYTITAEFEPIASQRKRLEDGGTPIRINEVSAGNDININEYFKKNDWLELYNTTDEDIDLNGMYLSDKKKNPQKYQITASEGVSTIIPAHGTRIVWCDGEAPLSQLHAPFKLDNADGSIVSIQAEDGTWADKVSYLAQPRWQTYGRYPDGGNHETLFTQPTIDQSNRLGTFDFESITADEWNGTDMAITLELANGWNWISHNMADAVSSTRFTGYAQCLKSQNGELFHDANLGWQGNVSMLEVAQGYKLQMKQTSEVTLRGDLFSPSTEVSVQKGWNWIGFPLYNATTLEAALSNYVPTDGDLLVGLTGFATYEDGAWTGTLSSLTPGQAYLLKSGVSQDFCWHSLSSVHAKRRRYEVPRLEVNSPWSVDIHAYPNVMNMIARVEIDGQEAMDGSYSLGVFAGDECRGVGQMENGLLYLTIHGNGGEALTFRLMDQEGQTFEADQHLTLREQTLEGSRCEPYLLSFGGQADGIQVALGQYVKAVQYYSLDGRRLQAPAKGICLQKTIYQDGRTSTRKVMY